MPPIDDHITAPNGRRVAYAEWGGVPGGHPVVLVHRSPGSRLLDPDAEATAAAGVRLIIVDRPGTGGTAPVADPTRAAHVGDVVAVLDALELRAVDLVGWSGGGQFALVAAAALGGRARSLTLMCSPAPDTEVRWLPDPLRALAATIAEDPVAGVALAYEAASGFIDPDGLTTVDGSAADARTRERPGVVERLRAMYVEAVRQGPVGPAFDIVAGSRDANLPAPQLPVRLFYGDDDQQVGVEHGRWYAERLGAQLTVVPGAGHLLPLDHWSEVLSAVRGR